MYLYNYICTLHVHNLAASGTTSDKVDALRTPFHHGLYVGTITGLLSFETQV